MQEEIDKRVDLALNNREKEYVDSVYPYLDNVTKGMLGAKYKKPEKKPETLKELFVPMIQILKELT